MINKKWLQTLPFLYTTPTLLFQQFADHRFLVNLLLPLVENMS